MLFSTSGVGYNRDVSSLRLSLLDLGGRRAGGSCYATIAELVRVARLIEAAGFSRLWLAEHRNTGDAWAAAAPLVAHLAARTSTLRIGAAGVLLAYADPYEVVSTFRLLETLSPRRIDLGLAGGAPADGALRATVPLSALPSKFAENVAELVHLRSLGLDTRIGDGERLPLPVDAENPPIWLLGSGTNSRDLALKHSTAFCYSTFLAPDPDPAVVRTYLREFSPTESLPNPLAAVATSLVCAETDEEAMRIAQRQAPRSSEPFGRTVVIGGPKRCAEKLLSMADEYGVAEIVLVDHCRTMLERERSLSLLAREVLSGERARVLQA